MINLCPLKQSESCCAGAGGTKVEGGSCPYRTRGLLQEGSEEAIRTQRDQSLVVAGQDAGQCTGVGMRGLLSIY